VSCLFRDPFRASNADHKRTKGLLMAYNFMRMPEERWRRVDKPQQLPLVRARLQFTNGVQVERKDDEYNLCRPSWTTV
jgi:hypothetical protein